MLSRVADTESNLKILRDELKELTATLKDDIRKMADHVQAESHGDPDEIHSAGFTVIGDPTPRGPLTQVENLRVQTSDNEGELQVRYKTVEGAATYVVEYSTTPDGPWLQATITTRTTHTLTGLTPGTMYWVRARAVGTTGFGPWSDPACRMAA